MKTTTKLLWLLGTCFLAVDGVYIFWSVRADNVEMIGAITIGVSALLCFFIAFYFGKVLKAGGPVPWAEDAPDAEIDDGDPEVGFYSPWSWWPIILAGAISIFSLGLAVGWWVSVIGAGLLVISVVGWVFEYYRGYFAR